MDIKATTIGRKRRPFAERFWEKIAIGDDDKCWEWQAARNAKGYGRLTSGRGVYLKAHRVAFALSNGGFVADETHVLHHCDNPPCCNPTHLFIGTPKDNTADMIRKGRWSRPPVFYGDQHWKRRHERGSKSD